MITRFDAHIYTSEETPLGVEGEIVKNASVCQRQLYAPPTKDDEIKALRAEVHTLRQVLYHRATYSEERDFSRFRSLSKATSTSTVAQAVNRIASTGFGISYMKSIKLAPQFIFRLTYQVIENVIGSSGTRWEEKPSGLSKLKWLWQNNLLFMMPYAINAIEAVVQEMAMADSKGTMDVLKKLEQKMSKKTAKKTKP